MRIQPQRSLAAKGLTVWRLYGVIETLSLAAVAGILTYVTTRFNWSIIIVIVSWLIVALAIVFLVIVFPKVRFDRWRYEVREDEIEVQHGIFITKRTVVPMVRVQHVDTTQGPILKKYDLSNISISTAATTHIIPALITEDADALRVRISELAKVAEEDV